MLTSTSFSSSSPSLPLPRGGLVRTHSPILSYFHSAIRTTLTRCVRDSVCSTLLPFHVLMLPFSHSFILPFCYVGVNAPSQAELAEEDRVCEEREGGQESPVDEQEPAPERTGGPASPPLGRRGEGWRRAQVTLDHRKRRWTWRRRDLCREVGLLFPLHCVAITVRIDRQNTLQDLKEKLAEHVQQPATNFKVTSLPLWNSLSSCSTFSCSSFVHSPISSHSPSPSLSLPLTLPLPPFLSLPSSLTVPRPSLFLSLSD